MKNNKCGSLVVISYKENSRLLLKGLHLQVLQVATIEDPPSVTQTCNALPSRTLLLVGFSGYYSFTSDIAPYIQKLSNIKFSSVAKDIK